jgi:hypothetical protein
MRVAARRTSGAVIDGRAQQRMAELEPLPHDCKHTGLLRRIEDAAIEAEAAKGVHHRLHALPTARCGHQKAVARRGAQVRQSMKQRTHERWTHGQRLLDRLLAGELRLAEDQGHLQQRQWIAFGAVGQELAHVDRQRPMNVVKQGARGRPLESSERNSVYPVALTVEDRPRTCGHQHGDSFAAQAPRGEQQRVRRGGVEPLSVVHDDQHRLAVAGHREEAEHSSADRKAIAGRRVTPGERPLQGARLRVRHRAEAIQFASAQLRQPCERKIGLRLDSTHTEHAHTNRLRDRPRAQRALTDARLA